MSWWRAEGNASDSADGNNGTLKGGATTGPGLVGQAFRFDGSTGYFQANDSANLQLTTGLTASAWINFNVDPASRSALGIFAKGVDADSPIDWALTVTGTSSPILGPGRLRGHVKVGGRWVFFDGNTVLQPNRWYHVAMTYDGATLSLYVNGVLDGSMSVGGPLQATPGTSLRLGAYSPVNGGASQHFFSGSIDEPMVFNRALSAAEVAAGVVPAAFVPVTRTGDTSGAATVHYATADGTAHAGTDYVATSGDLTFAAGETSKTVAVPLLDDADGPANETFTVALSSPSGAALGTPATATVTINENGEGVRALVGSISPTAGTPFSGAVGVVTDANPLATGAGLTVTIDWGDGHRTPGSLVALGGGRFEVRGGNTYAAGGTYTLTLAVSAPDGSSASDSTHVFVATPKPPPPHGITARLVTVRVSRKKTKLAVRVFDAVTGVLVTQFDSPFQKPAYTNIQTSLLDSNGDGVADEVVVTARKNRKTFRAVFSFA